ncbi:hypothetical protein G3496_08490 [Shewanella baltica]|nr:hypothetical protein [Shewanella baltica]
MVGPELYFEVPVDGFEGFYCEIDMIHVFSEVKWLYIGIYGLGLLCIDIIRLDAVKALKTGLAAASIKQFD